MVHALGTPKRHPASGISFLSKRVPERLREVVGKREIKVSLRTRDAAIARIRNLEEMLPIERQWAQFDGIVTRGDGSVAAYVARRWIPWICAYTGARVNEITSLTGRDFIVRDGGSEL